MNVGGYMYVILDVLAVLALGGAIFYGASAWRTRRGTVGSTESTITRPEKSPAARAAGFIALTSAAAFIVAVVVAGVMQVTPEKEFPPTADYGEARTPSAPNTTPEVANPSPPLNPHQPADTE